MWTPLSMMPAPEGYRVVEFEMLTDSQGNQTGLRVIVRPAVALVMAEYSDEGDGLPVDEPGTRRLTFAYANSTGDDDVSLFLNGYTSGRAFQLIPPGEEPDQDYGVALLRELREITEMNARNRRRGES